MATYFTGDLKTKRFAAVVGLILLALGLALGGLTVMEAQNPRRFLGYYFAVVLAAAGIYFLAAAAKVGASRLSITSEGVAYGRKVFLWSEIAELGIGPGGDLYCVPHNFGFGAEFPISRRLSRGQIDELFSQLTRDVKPRYPELRLRPSA